MEIERVVISRTAQKGPSLFRKFPEISGNLEIHTNNRLQLPSTPAKPAPILPRMILSVVGVLIPTDIASSTEPIPALNAAFAKADHCICDSSPKLFSTPCSIKNG